MKMTTNDNKMRLQRCGFCGSGFLSNWFITFGFNHGLIFDGSFDEDKFDFDSPKENAQSSFIITHLSAFLKKKPRIQVPLKIVINLKI